MSNYVNICEVCKEIFAGGDAPKTHMSVEKNDTYKIPIYSNGEASNGLYGYTDFAKVTEPSITVSARGTIGYTAIRTEPFVPIVRLITLIPNLDIIDIRYLYYAVQNYDFSGRGTSIPQLTVPMLKKYSFFLPDKDSQKQVVFILDNVNNLLSLFKKAINKLNELVKSRFIEMFGDPHINPYKWSKVKISHAVTIEPQNGMYKPQTYYLANGTGIPILRIDGFYNGSVTDFAKLKRLRCSEDDKNRYLLNEDDIVINRVNSLEYLGKCAHIKGLLEETVFESNMMRMHFEPKRFNPVYIVHLLCSSFIHEQIINHAKKAVNQASINQKDVMDFNIFEPPIGLQNQFANFVESTDKLKFEVKQSLEKLETLKKSLMQKYFG